MTTSSKLMETVAVSALTGGIAYGACKAMGNSGSVTYLGQNMDVCSGVGIGAAVGSAVGEVASNFILPMIPGNSALAGYEGSIVKPLLAGTGTVAALKLASGNEYPLQQMGMGYQFGIGAGSNLVAQYGYDKFAKPMFSR